MTQAKTTFLSDYTPPDFLINAVDLHFKLSDSVTEVDSCLTISRNPAAKKITGPLILNGEQLKLISIKIKDQSLTKKDYKLTKNELIIFNVPNEFILEIKTQIKPNKNTSLSGLYISRDIFCTQCEAEGFRRITYFLDRPDVLSTYTTTIIADKKRYPILLSNGNKIATKLLANNQHSITWQDPFKKPSYLFALVAGKLKYIEDVFVTNSKRKVLLQIFFEEGQRKKCYHALSSLKKAMLWDEAAYGREYDLDIFMIAVIDDFNMGAMENKGLNIFNSQTVLAAPQSATDADYNYVTRVVGHEYFHNWTGNRITCRDWFQLSLKEGLTVFREQEFSETISLASIERINTVKLLRSLQFAEDAGPLAHSVQPDSYIEINNFYTMTIYEKGAEIIRMMKVLVGADLFRKGMDIYFRRYDGQAATIEDFIRSIEEGSGYDLQQFRLWYKQSGTPIVSVQYCYNKENHTFSLIVKQTCPPTPNQPTKKAFCFPLLMGLLNSEGHSINLQLANESKSFGKQRVLKIDKSENHFQFINIPSKPIPSLLRNFSAPVKLNISYSDEDLAFLIRYDSDDFNRWNAMQELAKRVVMQGIKNPIHNNEAVCLLIKTYEKLLMNLNEDNKALTAELLIMPNEAYFAEQMDIIDIEGINKVRNQLRKKIACDLRNQLLEIYKTNQNFGAYVFNEKLHAQRHIKNICLNYLMLLEDFDINNLAITQYRKANNITDSVSALIELVDNNVVESVSLLKDFYEKHQDDSLVVCKWFTIQARAPLVDTLQRVNGLLKHSAFDWKNPNKVRSLIGTFCTQNQIVFHQINGSAYSWLREKILYLDKINSQIAARLLKPLTYWQRFDEIRSQLMREQLIFILKNPNISADVYEIASKSLEDK